MSRARTKGTPWWWKWWPGTVASLIVKAVVMGPLRSAYAHASTQIQQIEYVVVGSGLLIMVFAALMVLVLKYPKWVGNLMLAGAAVAAIYVLIEL